MAKIGRNDPCFCGSGKKFKKCCLGTQAKAVPAVPSLKAEVEKIQELAKTGKDTVLAVGVFILFATTGGDAWLLEVTEMDAIQVATGGEKIAVEIEENPETIEINWTHRFKFKDRQIVFTAYKDESETIPGDYPVHSIQAALKRIRKRIPAELLSTIHLNNK